MKPLDLNGRIPKIRVSICTGEATGGFIEEASNRFIEVMRLASDEDYETFYAMCGTRDIERMY